MTPSTSSSYAGFWKRVGAALIDGIIVGAAVSVLTALLLPGTVPLDGMHGQPQNGALSTLAGWLYFALFESSAHQATPGKMLLGIVVTDEAGKRVGFGRASGRHFAKILSGVLLCIGFLMVAFTKKKQGLHDMLAKTLVVNK